MIFDPVPLTPTSMMLWPPMVTTVSAQKSMMATLPEKAAAVIPRPERSSGLARHSSDQRRTDDDVMAEARGELKCVVAGPAVHRVIASTTDDDVITTAGINDVITALAIDHVTVAIEGDAVITLTANDILDAAEAVAADPLLGSGGAQTLRGA